MPVGAASGTGWASVPALEVVAGAEAPRAERLVGEEGGTAVLEPGRRGCLETPLSAMVEPEALRHSAPEAVEGVAGVWATQTAPAVAKWAM